MALIKNDIIHRDLKPDNILVNIDWKKNRLIYKVIYILQQQDL